jgi:hypothetical protein
MAVDLIDRLAIFVATWRFLIIGTADSRSLRCESFARMKEFVRRPTCVPFCRFRGDVSLELMQHLHVVLHGLMGSYPRDALHKGGCCCYLPPCSAA